MSDPTDTPPLKTPLYDAHVGLGGRMVPFAGYLMPVQYPSGILAEHAWTRAHAGLFDVSHMGQALLVGADHATTAAALEALIPAAIRELGPGRQRYSQLTAADGGILDDLMVSRPTDAPDGTLFLVVNAACKTADYAHIAAHLPAGVMLQPIEDRALLALQGPEAEAVMTALRAPVASMKFMDAAPMTLLGIPTHVSRSGYTG
jgi:aminomethyltransferase